MVAYKQRPAANSACLLIHHVVILLAKLNNYSGGWMALWYCLGDLILTLTLLHSERPKLHTILAFLRAVGLKVVVGLQTSFCQANADCIHCMSWPIIPNF